MHVSRNSWLPLWVARRPARREESLMMGNGWLLTTEVIWSYPWPPGGSTGHGLRQGLGRCQCRCRWWCSCRCQCVQSRCQSKCQSRWRTSCRFPSPHFPRLSKSPSEIWESYDSNYHLPSWWGSPFNKHSLLLAEAALSTLKIKTCSLNRTCDWDEDGLHLATGLPLYICW